MHKYKCMLLTHLCVNACGLSDYLSLRINCYKRDNGTSFYPYELSCENLRYILQRNIYYNSHICTDVPLCVYVCALQDRLACEMFLDNIYIYSYTPFAPSSLLLRTKMKNATLNMCLDGKMESNALQN